MRPTAIENMTKLGRSWHGYTFLSLTLCAGNQSVTEGFPTQRASNAEFCWFLYCQPRQAIEQVSKWPVQWGSFMFMWHHLNVKLHCYPEISTLLNILTELHLWWQCQCNAFKKIGSVATEFLAHTKSPQLFWYVDFFSDWAEMRE